MEGQSSLLLDTIGIPERDAALPCGYATCDLLYGLLRLMPSQQVELIISRTCGVLITFSVELRISAWRGVVAAIVGYVVAAKTCSHLQVPGILRGSIASEPTELLRVISTSTKRERERPSTLSLAWIPLLTLCFCTSTHGTRHDNNAGWCWFVSLEVWDFGWLPGGKRVRVEKALGSPGLNDSNKRYVYL